MTPITAEVMRAAFNRIDDWTKVHGFSNEDFDRELAAGTSAQEVMALALKRGFESGPTFAHIRESLELEAEAAAEFYKRMEEWYSPTSSPLGKKIATIALHAALTAAQLAAERET
jgi:hypothetical protein